jgi:hypothetical protein
MADPQVEAWLLQRASIELQLGEDELRQVLSKPEAKELLIRFMEGGKS